MGKIIQISIYSILIVFVFLFFGSLLNSCGAEASNIVEDTATQIGDNITEAGGNIVAKAENAIDATADEFEGEDIDYSSSDNSDSKTYTADTTEPDVEPETVESPSYVIDGDEPIYKAPEAAAAPKTIKKVTETVSSTVTSMGGSSGSYLLITGNYSQESNASSMVKKLKNKGFSSAEKIIFDGSRYYTVIAGRYPSMNAANSAKKGLGSIDSYVQKKRL